MGGKYPPNSTQSKGLFTGIRRRRLLICTILLFACFFYFVPFELPANLKDSALQGLSRANVAQIMRKKDVPEIYGLLHLITGDNEQQHVLSNDLQLDPTEPLPLSVYAAGDATLDWAEERAIIDKDFPLIVFSKTYCPYSKRAKELLEAYDTKPAPKIVEVDIRDDGNVIKHLLTRLTNHTTFPNILLRGKSIGGSDDLLELHNTNALTKLLEDNGVKPQSDGK
ncbi:thioredoxin-like protein [Panaeolus papilionaceus]|nr:thioredoxin-like protein [Panaeolus papilionaceus]